MQGHVSSRVILCLWIIHLTRQNLLGYVGWNNKDNTYHYTKMSLDFFFIKIWHKTTHSKRMIATCADTYSLCIYAIALYLSWLLFLNKYNYLFFIYWAGPWMFWSYIEVCFLFFNKFFGTFFGTFYGFKESRIYLHIGLKILYFYLNVLLLVLTGAEECVDLHFWEWFLIKKIRINSV